MKVVLAGPILTSALRDGLGISLEGAPAGIAVSPLVPLAMGLRDQGHSVHIVTTDASISEVVSYDEGPLTVTYCPVRGAPRYRARTRSLDLFEKEIRYLTTAMKAAQPDIVHAHWTYEFAEAAVRSKLPHLVTMHDLGWDYFWIMRDPYRFMRLMMKYRTMFRVRYLTVVAPFMIPKLKWYGFHGSAQCIPNGISISAQHVAKRISDGVFRFVTIGNPGSIKNVRASVEAFSIIQKYHPNSQLHLFGPGLDDNYESDNPHVYRHGNVDHSKLISFLVREGTVLIHPSRMEACPVIIAEAKAAGVPVVGGAHSGGVPFVCGVDAGCILVDIESPRSIAAAALNIVSSNELYSAMSEKALRDVRVRFENRQVTQQYIAAYSDVLEAPLS